MAIIKIKISFKIVNDFFAAVWLPLMIIPCPLIKSIYLSSIRDRGARRGCGGEALTKDGECVWSLGRYHLPGIKQLVKQKDYTAAAAEGKSPAASPAD